MKRKILYGIGVFALTLSMTMGNLQIVHATEASENDGEVMKAEIVEDAEPSGEDISKEEPKEETPKMEETVSNSSENVDKKQENQPEENKDVTDENQDKEEIGADHVAEKVIEIPDFTGKTIEEAEAAFTQLNVECVKKYEYATGVPVDVIVSQDMTGSINYIEGETKITITISLGEETTEETTEMDSTFGWAGRMGGCAISIDGNTGDWQDKPFAWMYNWQKPGPYSEETHHKISLCCDGENVFLYIKFAGDFYQRFNGYNYMFYVDGEPVQFAITDVSGTEAPGTYQATVRHGGGSVSWQVADGSQACLRVNPNGVNNELEVKIPFSTMEIQNPNIQPHEVRNVEYSSGNITGSTKISCEGASTGPIGFACFVLLAVPLSCGIIRKYYVEKRA